METALSTINVLPSNKEELVRFVKTLKYEILANDKNPLPILVQLKFIEKAIELAQAIVDLVELGRQGLGLHQEHLTLGHG